MSSGAGSILWYVHDHGAGHLGRAQAVIPHLPADVVVAVGPGRGEDAVATLDVPVVVLPSDVPAVAAPTVGPWHHAPASDAVRARSLAIADVVRRFRCTTAVVDVSVEVTVLARLLGLRVVTVRQSGRRDDPAHRLGFASADVVWVPQHRELEADVEGADDRWRFSGAFSRYDGHAAGSDLGVRAGGRRRALLAVGAGGTSLDEDNWRDSTPPPGWEVVIVGASARWSGADVCSVGRVAAFDALVRSADVVVASAGWGIVADAAALGARLVVVPEARPFDEQLVRARVLARAGLAGCCERWPSPDHLAAVLDGALRLDPNRWRRYYDGRGAARAAEMIATVHGA